MTLDLAILADVPRLAIITHHLDRFARTPYTLHSLIDRWTKQGVEIDLVEGARSTAPADLALLHVDLTVVPSDLLAIAARYSRCLNRHTPDISKRSISRLMVEPGDGYAGPVIVKSNLNSGGWMEAMKLGKGASGAPRQSVFEDYPIFDRADQVPEFMWTNREMIVERFCPEMCGGQFVTRLWLFLGRAEIMYRLVSDTPNVKSANTVLRERIDEVPKELRELRKELGFDYGKFDFGIVEGKAVLYDANRTPGFGKLTEAQAAERAEALAEGIWDFLDGASPA